MQRCQAVADEAGPAAEPAGDLAAEGASLAGPGAELPGLLAGRAPFPEGGVGVGAAGAQWPCPGSGVDRRDGVASRAASPPPSARRAPWLAGDLGDGTGPRLPAYPADRRAAGPAPVAPRPVSGAGRYLPHSPAAGACLGYVGSDWPRCDGLNWPHLLCGGCCWDACVGLKWPHRGFYVGLSWCVSSLRGPLWWPRGRVVRADPA